MKTADREALLTLLKTLKVGVGEPSDCQVMVCMRASTFDKEADHAFWEWPENQSEVRPDVRCSVCGEALAVSNAVYESYMKAENKPRVSCLECLGQQEPGR